MKNSDWERGNTPYLKKISELSFENMKWNRKKVLEIRDFLSPWNHNIKLPYNIFTAFCEDYYPAHEEMMTIINQQVKGNFKNKRVLDIACLEGYFSAECALQGAKVLGIEGKVINIKKCEFIKSVLKIPNLTFVRDDVMRITKSKYGRFDVVLALGILYHLDNPFRFLANLAKLCDGFVLLDTHVALGDQETLGESWKPHLSELRSFKFQNRTYTGRSYREFEAEATQLTKDLSCTASLKNEESAWLTEDSLIRLLRDVGFEQISKIVFPEGDRLWWDTRVDGRVLILAVKNRQAFKSKIHS